ncbi:MAG TPA: hypothetical protein DCY10_04015 [Clostridiales bacterium]|nr:hypothetical protein [Clostridiales bacterium]
MPTMSEKLDILHSFNCAGLVFPRITTDFLCMYDEYMAKATAHGVTPEEARARLDFWMNEQKSSLTMTTADALRLALRDCVRNS